MLEFPGRSKLKDPGILPRENLVQEEPGATFQSSSMEIRNTIFLGVFTILKPVFY